MTTTKPTLAFFGATGGCAAAALSAALRDNYTATALARTPDKLRTLLTTTHSIPSSTLATLTIHTGNVRNVSDVKKALISPTSPTHLVDTIISGIGGGNAHFQASLWKPVGIDDPHICETGVATMLAALASLADEGISTTASGAKPLLVAISTPGGCESGQRDLLVLLWPVFYWLLAEPYMDKKAMERLIFSAAEEGSGISDFVVIRPSLLMDGPARGLEMVRAGWVWGIPGVEGREEEQGPTLGCTVGRADVGEWIFQEVVRKGGWAGKCVTLNW
ncbi:uncharacterized protein BDZ99DRAFT_442128 [Mytilinidion resinicola]|uniref:NAD(P)-binding domain-containing protein n=1 Tax=Mytilinidion resinicola TaxID=574789 RepID=A0A6A6YT96_9PEZI|nr:uncharacterized protein BDZ99DRAFT_442128 [Mytilinidion resinicola]KAF2811254.1 hypothetical protein BDZ99DRAFT_442128 [Mytilinidion resinicola]